MSVTRYQRRRHFYERVSASADRAWDSSPCPPIIRYPLNPSPTASDSCDVIAKNTLHAISGWELRAPFTSLLFLHFFLISGVLCVMRYGDILRVLAVYGAAHTNAFLCRHPSLVWCILFSYVKMSLSKSYVHFSRSFIISLFKFQIS